MAIEIPKYYTLTKKYNSNARGNVNNGSYGKAKIWGNNKQGIKAIPTT